MNSTNFNKEKNPRLAKNSADANNENNYNHPDTGELERRADSESHGAPEPRTESADFLKPDASSENLKQKEGEMISAQKESGFLDDSIVSLKKLLGVSKKKARQTHIPQVRDSITVQIEHIMEEGLQEAYKELSTIEQQEFKIKGEETAWQIRTLLNQAKIKIKKIFKLLVEWLRMLPGINRFFLEQEAKIKVDKIISLRNNRIK